MKYCLSSKHNENALHDDIAEFSERDADGFEEQIEKLGLDAGPSVLVILILATRRTAHAEAEVDLKVGDVSDHLRICVRVIFCKKIAFYKKSFF